MNTVHSVIGWFICAMFAFASVPVASAAAPEPLAEWYGDFDVTTKEGCTLTVGEGNVVAADGSTITIGSTEGVRVSWGDQRSMYTVVVRYRDLSAPSSAAVLAGHAGGSSSGFMMTTGGKSQGMYLGKAYKSALAAYPVADGAGCYAMAFSRFTMAQTGGNGQVLYVKTADGEWQHHATNAGAISSSVDGKITGCVIAGPCAGGSYPYALSTMAGMKIEAIVVFAEPLTLAEVSACSYPAQIYSAEISAGGEYTWAGLPWRGGRVPFGDISAYRMEIQCDAAVTIADSPLVVTAATVKCSGTGTLTFTGETEFGVKARGRIEMNLATSGDGALTLAEGDWYLGRKKTGYKEFTIAGTNPVVLNEDASLSVYNGRVGSPVAGYGTIRAVDLFPRTGELDVALTNSALWHGNCVLEEIDNDTYTMFSPDTFGNETSKLTFNGVKVSYLKYIYPTPAEADTPVFKPEIIIENHPNKEGIGFGLTAGCSGAYARFRKVSGGGALVDLWAKATGSANHMLVFQDWTAFTGSVQLKSNLRVTFGETYSGSGVSGNGFVLIRPGVPLSLDANSKIHGWITNATSAVVVQGTLEVVSARAFCGGRVVVKSGGELVFDADKAQAVSDATLTDCSAEADMSRISGEGLIRFKGSYAPFIMPSTAVSNLSSAVAVRIDGATVKGDLAVASRFGGSGVFGDGTLSILDGATLDLTWGTMTLADTATLAAAPASFVIASGEFASVGKVKLFSAAAETIPESWQGITVKVVSPDGSKSGCCRTVLRSDGLYGERLGMRVILR